MVPGVGGASAMGAKYADGKAEDCADGEGVALGCGAGDDAKKGLGVAAHGVGGSGDGAELAAGSGSVNSGLGRAQGGGKRSTSHIESYAKHAATPTDRAADSAVVASHWKELKII